MKGVAEPQLLSKGKWTTMEMLCEGSQAWRIRWLFPPSPPRKGERRWPMSSLEVGRYPCRNEGPETMCISHV